MSMDSQVDSNRPKCRLIQEFVLVTQIPQTTLPLIRCFPKGLTTLRKVLNKTTFNLLSIDMVVEFLENTEYNKTMQTLFCVYM